MSGDNESALPPAQRSARAAAQPPARDAQRSGVYAAEAQVARILDRSSRFPTISVAGSTLTLPVERHFGDIDGVQRYVDAALALNWIRARWPDRAGTPVRVRARRGAAMAHYEQTGAVIAVPVAAGSGRWALRELVVLHELAHHLGAPDDLTHGPDFRLRMLALADGLIAPEAAFLLTVAYADQGFASA